MTTVFIIIFGEDWNWSMYQYVRSVEHNSLTYHFTLFYFSMLIIVGNFVMMTVLTGILMREFDSEIETGFDLNKSIAKVSIFTKVKKFFSKKKMKSLILNIKNLFDEGYESQLHRMNTIK